MITISLRTYSSHIKSLLHFNYPYYSESGDGLFDDILGFCWTRSGSAKLAASESPADLILSGTPKFGYRCLHTESNSDYIHCTLSSSLTLTQIEASMWVRVTASGTGNILLLKNGSNVVLMLTLSSDLKLSASSTSPTFSLASSETLALNSWVHIRLQVSTSGVRLSVNNSAGASQSFSAASLPAFNTLQLGGIHGEIDEFVLRDSFTTTLPTEPENAVCNVNSIGGFGTGKLGNVTITASRLINSSAKAALSSGMSSLTLTGRNAGSFGDFAAGDEVMLVDMASGAYEFRTLSAVSGNTLHVATPFTIIGSALQVIQIPNFNTLTINSGITITPKSWDGNSGGIVAFRCKGSCTVNGSIITSGFGRPRTDSLQMTHSKLIDSFITNTGGGIFITCGGTFTAGSAARLGAAWSGSGTGGAIEIMYSGYGGGAGYGGGGGSYHFHYSSVGAAGKIGWGGGGGAPIDQIKNNGGQAGFDGGKGTVLNGGIGGTNIILIAKTLKADSAAISTGGGGGEGGSRSGYVIESQASTGGGGGTGFCYIACERMA